MSVAPCTRSSFTPPDSLLSLRMLRHLQICKRWKNKASERYFVRGERWDERRPCVRSLVSYFWLVTLALPIILPFIILSDDITSPSTNQGALYNSPRPEHQSARVDESNVWNLTGHFPPIMGRVTSRGSVTSRRLGYEWAEIKNIHSVSSAQWQWTKVVLCAWNRVSCDLISETL